MFQHKQGAIIPRMTQTSYDFKTIAGLKIHYHSAGSGNPILLLHGWGANIDLMWPLGERLVGLGYCVYALDLPGFGKSDEPPRAWSVFDYATFVLQFMDAFNLETAHLFGHSFGGRLSLILGADHANRIHKIALSNSAGIVQPTPLLPKLRLRLYKGLRDTLYKVGAKALADELRQRYNARYGSSDFNQVSGIMRETFVKVVNQDLLAYAARVQPSTLLFWGDADMDTPLWMGKKLEATIPDAGLIVYDGAGHYTYLERLADVVRVMDHFFKANE